ncbi:MAG: T9SS type A sorting domain-containing protein [Candidatus Cloacimonetes bacterium]|nr:T9SS type A sorting domain-containing protein [Candidatus Cloacimonadota bacterium]
MKKLLLLVSLMLIVSYATAQFWTEDFETGTQYTVTLGAEGEDGSTDYFIRTDDNVGHNINMSYDGVSGYFFTGQDIDDGGWSGSTTPSQLTWSGINISDKTNIQFSGDFGEDFQTPGDIDDEDYLLVEYQIDGGGWNNLIAFENDGTQYNTDFWEDTNFDGDGEGTTITSADGTMIPFTKSIPGTGSSLDLRFTASVDSGDEDFAIDNFELTADPPTAVTLSEFTAEYVSGNLVLYWTTQSETGNLGWNIFRGESEDALILDIAMKINTDLIPGAGNSSEPNDYSFIDETVTVPGTTYSYWIESLNYSGETQNHGPITLTIPENNQENPDPPDLAINDIHNYPNPFSPDTQISFMMSEHGHVEVTVYNIKGQEVIQLYNGYCSKDRFSINWNGKDKDGNEINSGVYPYIIKSGSKTYLRKMILSK